MVRAGVDSAAGARRLGHAGVVGGLGALRAGSDVEAHARTVFRGLAGRATFARLDDAAVGIAVEHGGLVGLFCLAVDPKRRRSGLGSGLARSLLAGSGARTAYLQVEEANAPAVALYERLGFQEAYRYCHRVAPG